MVVSIFSRPFHRLRGVVPGSMLGLSRLLFAQKPSGPDEFDAAASPDDADGAVVEEDGDRRVQGSVGELASPVARRRAAVDDGSAGNRPRGWRHGVEKPDAHGRVGSETFEQDFALSLVVNQQETLAEIKVALEKIKDGTYGLCEVCLKEGKTAAHSLIRKERLKAIPYAATASSANGSDPPAERGVRMEDSPAVSTVPARCRDDVDGTYPSSRVVLFGAIVAFGLVVDLASKSVVFARLGYPHRSSDWTWGTPLLWGRFDIRLTTSFNQGALFGLGQGFTPVFALLSVVAVGFVLWWLFRKGEARSLLLTVALGLVSAGALGNLYDRLWMHGCRTLEACR